MYGVVKCAGFLDSIDLLINGAFILSSDSQRCMDGLSGIPLEISFRMSFLSINSGSKK